MLYEFRSEDKYCLRIMEVAFENIIEKYLKEDLDITVEVLGARPCGSGVDEDELNVLTQKHVEIIQIHQQ